MDCSEAGTEVIGDRFVVAQFNGRTKRRTSGAAQGLLPICNRMLPMCCHELAPFGPADV